MGTSRILVFAAASLLAAGTAQAQTSTHFDAHLERFNAGGAPVDTNASGQAQFEVIDGGTAVRYRVNVAGIVNAWMAHIHVAPAPVAVTDPAGPIAFWFMPTTPTAPPPAGVNVAERLQGNLAAGLIMSDD